MNAPVAFLSHSSDNSPIAKRLAADLRSQGVDVWLDQWEIRPGDSLRQKIDEGIEKASFFLVLLTPESLRSKWVQVELDAGMVKRIEGTCRLIPILLRAEEEQLPPTLRGIVWVRLDDYQEGLRRLIAVCHGVETKPPLGPPPQGDAFAADGTEEVTLPRKEPQGSTYDEWVATMRMAKRDGQLVAVVADYQHAAERFESKEKFILPEVLSKYLDTHGFARPFTPEDYAQFEWRPTQDGRRVWLQAKREGTVSIEAWRSWDKVPWDWLLVEAYAGLLYFQDDRLLNLFQARNVVRSNVTLGNLLSPGWDQG